MGKSQAVMGICDIPMWQSIEQRQLKLMACADCGTFRYPPAPICPKCLSLEAEWRPVSGRGVVVSWVVFHKGYFEDFKPPYNSVAVRLEEGPIIVSNLIGPEPEGSWIGRKVVLNYVDHDGRIQHAVRIAEDA